jgi:hypothetical protein
MKSTIEVVSLGTIIVSDVSTKAVSVTGTVFKSVSIKGVVSRDFGEVLEFVNVVSSTISGSSMSTSSNEGKMMSVTDIVDGIGDFVIVGTVSPHARFVKFGANEFCWVIHG